MKLLIVVLLVVFLTPAHRIPECVCIKEAHPSNEKIKADRKKAFDGATAVFEGEVVALDSYVVTFRLRKRWKGPSVGEVTLRTGAVAGYDGTPLPEECSYQFQRGEAYLVYAYGEAEKMKTSICSTFKLQNASEEEKGLDEIKAHSTVREKNP